MIYLYQNGFFKNLLKVNLKKYAIYNQKPLRQRARKNKKLDDKELNKELAKKLIVL